MFPPPSPAVMGRCKCGKKARVDRMVEGLGSTCAERAGLTTTTPRLRGFEQSGPDLFDNADEEMCDGWDR